MGFTDGFYSFSLDINNSNSSLFESKNFKLVKHPEESLEFLSARILIYSFLYQEDLKISDGYFDPMDPTIYIKNYTEDYLLWVHIGELRRKKMKLGLRHKDANLKVFFYTQEQIEVFSHKIKKLKNDDIEKIEFYLIDYSFLESLASIIDTKNSWGISVVDDEIYVSIDKQSFNSKIDTINIYEYIFTENQT